MAALRRAVKLSSSAATLTEQRLKKKGNKKSLQVELEETAKQDAGIIALEKHTRIGNKRKREACAEADFGQTESVPVSRTHSLVPPPIWMSLGVGPAQLRADVSLNNGQSFVWRNVGVDEWHGVVSDGFFSYT